MSDSDLNLMEFVPGVYTDKWCDDVRMTPHPHQPEKLRESDAEGQRLSIHARVADREQRCECESCCNNNGGTGCESDTKHGRGQWRCPINLRPFTDADGMMLALQTHLAEWLNSPSVVAYLRPLCNKILSSQTDDAMQQAALNCIRFARGAQKAQINDVKNGGLCQYVAAIHRNAQRDNLRDQLEDGDNLGQFIGKMPKKLDEKTDAKNESEKDLEKEKKMLKKLSPPPEPTLPPSDPILYGVLVKIFETEDILTEKDKDYLIKTTNLTEDDVVLMRCHLRCKGVVKEMAIEMGLTLAVAYHRRQDVIEKINSVLDNYR